MIDQRRLNQIENNLDNDDEYISLAWGSRDDIRDLLEYIEGLQKKTFSDVISILGLSLKNISDMKRYFAEKLIDINELYAGEKLIK